MWAVPFKDGGLCVNVINVIGYRPQSALILIFGTLKRDP